MTDRQPSIRDAIIATAREFRQLCIDGARDHAAFTDTDLLPRVEQLVGRRVERNVIARSRALLEEEVDSPIERYGEFTVNGRALLHFKLREG